MKHILLVFLFLISIGIYGQVTTKIEDSLESKGYDYLYKKAGETRLIDRFLFLKYSTAYLNKAKKAASIDHQLVGHHLLARAYTNDSALAHTDTIIRLSKSNPSEKYPAGAYILKGSFYSKQGEFKKSLDNYLIADSLTEKDVNPYWNHAVKLNIGILKSKIGDDKSALIEYHNVLSHLEKKKDTSRFYPLLLFAIASSHNSKMQLDSAYYYNNLGVELTRKTKNPFYNYLILNNAALDYSNGQYQKSIDSLNTIYPFLTKIDDKDNLSMYHFYKGLSYFKQEQKLIAINYLKKVDVLFEKNGVIDPRLRRSWEVLIDYYREQDDPQSELFYIKRLLTVDSVLHSQYKSLNKNLTYKYDIPQLLKFKEKIIADQKIKEKRKNIALYGAVLLIVLLTFFFYRHRKKEYQKNQKYEQLIAQYKSGNLAVQKKKTPASSIPQKDIEKIERAIIQYEEHYTYAQNNFNKEFIRKDTGVNDHYIADYFRDYMGCSLTTYINNKRVELTIKKMINDKNFPKYTMKGMAETLGYKGVDTFRTAFKERTGLRPLEFLKKLQSKKK